MKVKKILLLSDFFSSDLPLPGGAEFCDDVLKEELAKKGFQVVHMRCGHVTQELLEYTSDYFKIVSNFVDLKEEWKQWLQVNKRYIIYEHDHKYVDTRNPLIYGSDMIVPPTKIVNREFYENAKYVITQSKYHDEIVKKNVKCRTKCAGVSLWTSEQYSHLEQMCTNGKVGKTCGVIESKTLHKNTWGGIQYCVINELKCVLLRGEWKEMMNKLSTCSMFAFFPQSPETFSRTTAEARMLGLRVAVDKKVGVSHEDWFSSYKGMELIIFLRKKQEEWFDWLTATLESFILADSELVGNTEKTEGDIVVVLNMYRRPQNLMQQIESLQRQTVKPKEIWLWVNAHEDNKNFDFSVLKGKIHKVFNNDHNWKFYGRFAAGLLTDAKYVAFFDDDTIPGTEWFENCLETIKSHPGVLGSAGVVLETEQAYNPHTRVGWPNPNEDVCRVDLVGHAWFMERKTLSSMWREVPITWENGEDMFLSYCVQKYEGLGTHVPPHPRGNKKRWGSVKGNELGIDSVASSNGLTKPHSQFFQERDRVIEHCIKNGWRLCKVEAKTNFKNIADCAVAETIMQWNCVHCFNKNYLKHDMFLHHTEHCLENADLIKVKTTVDSCKFCGRLNDVIVERKDDKKK